MAKYHQFSIKKFPLFISPERYQWTSENPLVRHGEIFGNLHLHHGRDSVYGINRIGSVRETKYPKVMVSLCSQLWNSGGSR